MLRSGCYGNRCDMKKRCFIAGAGEYCGLLTPSAGDFVIAADGGYAELVSRGISPDLVVGDFDSLGEIPDHPNVIRTNVEKDDTDMVTAVKEGIARGFNEFIIDGGLGGRLDHTFANIQTIVFLAQNNARGYLIGKDTTITAITDSSIAYIPEAKGRISVFASGNTASGVTISGLKYTLANGLLTNDYPLGVSNEFVGEPAVVSVTQGTLIIMWTGGLDAIAK